MARADSDVAANNSPTRVDWRGLGASVVLHLSVAIWLCQDAVFSGGKRVVGAHDTETWIWLWGHSWMSHSLFEQGRFPYRTTLVDHPDGISLWLKDPLSLLLTLPIQLVAGVRAAFTASELLIFVLAGAGFFLLARSLGIGRVVAVLGGLVFAFCPHALGEAYNANTEAFNAGWCALWLWAMLRAARAPGVLNVLLAGALLTALLVTNQYFAIAMAALSGPLLAAGVWAWRRERAWWRQLAAVAAAVALGLALFVPFGQILLGNISNPGDAALLGGKAEWMVPFVSDARHLLQPMARLNGPHTMQTTFQDLVYPGFGVLALCLAAPLLGPRGPWRWAWPAAALWLVLMAMGPVLMWDAELVRLGGEPLRLPWFYLVSDRPVLEKLTLPHRMMMPAALFLALGLAWTAEGVRQRVDRLGRGRWVGAAVAAALIIGAFVEILAYPPYELPLKTVDARIPAHAPVLGAARAPGALLNLPFQMGSNLRTRYLYWQTAHHRPVGTSLDTGPPPAVVRRVPLLQRLAALQRGARALPAADPGARTQLARQGYAYVVFHPAFFPRACPGLDLAAYQRLLAASFGAGLRLPDGAVAFALSGPAAASLRQALAAHAPRGGR